jgi:hypothetical protein
VVLIGRPWSLGGFWRFKSGGCGIMIDCSSSTFLICSIMVDGGMLVFKRSRRFRLHCCPYDVAAIYDLGTKASQNTVAGTQIVYWRRWMLSPISSGNKIT